MMSYIFMSLDINILDTIASYNYNHNNNNVV